MNSILLAYRLNVDRCGQTTNLPLLFMSTTNELTLLEQSVQLTQNNEMEQEHDLLSWAICALTQKNAYSAWQSQLSQDFHVHPAEKNTKSINDRLKLQTGHLASQEMSQTTFAQTETRPMIRSSLAPLKHDPHFHKMQ
jgi:hypothetical protein